MVWTQGISYLCSVIVRVKVVFRKTVVGDWRFDYLGWVRTYHFETRTITVFLSLWDKHAAMPPMRIAVSFDGRIVIHDHIPTNTLRALSPLPHYLTWYVLFLVALLFTVHQSIHLHVLFIIHFLPTFINALFVFHTLNSTWWLCWWSGNSLWPKGFCLVRVIVCVGHGCSVVMIMRRYRRAWPFCRPLGWWEEWWRSGPLSLDGGL